MKLNIAINNGDKDSRLVTYPQKHVRDQLKNIILIQKLIHIDHLHVDDVTTHFYIIH